MIEAIKKLSRNTLFRLSLLGAFLFVISLAVALGYVYFATITAELNRVDRSIEAEISELQQIYDCLLYTSPSPRDATLSRMPSSA